MVKPVGGSPPSQGPMATNDPQNTTPTPTTGGSEDKGGPPKSVSPEVSRKAHEAVTQDAAVMLRQAELQKGAASDVKKIVLDSEKSKLDGAAGLSKSEYEAIKKTWHDQPQSKETIQWMQKERPHLYASLTSNLDYSGYVGTTIGSLNLTKAGDELKADAESRSLGLDRLPPLKDFGPNGLPKKLPGADPLGNHPETMEPVNGYKTGENYTKVIGDKLGKISDEDAMKSRQAQTDFCTKMSGIIGTDVKNPPSVNAARGYFQTMANRGASPEQIKSEYSEYLKTFYQHPGGVDWKPPLDPKNIDAAFSQQPVAKDGKRLIDCEGYAALTENVLGGIQKNGKPMFDIEHGAGPGHVVCGVFPHGGDPTKGFVVDNNNVGDVKLDPRLERDFKASPNQDTQMRFLVREYMKSHGEGAPTDYGTTYTQMKPPAGKVAVKQ